jgi:hypothetical protein
MAITQLSPAPVIRVWDNSGNLAVGGLIYTYIAGTSTPSATYTDSTGGTPNTNPIVLNSRGEASIWIPPVNEYKFVAYDASGNLLWSQDHISLGSLLAADVANSAQVVPTIAALRSLSKNSLSSTALVLGYYAIGDGGGGTYYYNSADTSSADNGGTIIVATDGARWYLTNIQAITFEQFGAVGDGSTDDTTVIQKCIDTVGGIYPIRPLSSKNYSISDTIEIGNGSNSAPSTQNGIAIMGSGAGITESEFAGGGYSTRFTWNGVANGLMFNIQGPIYGINVSGISFDCNHLAGTAVQFNHICDSEWTNVLAFNYVNDAYQWYAYTTPTGCVVGSSGNTFTNVSSKAPGTNGNGAVFGSPAGNAGELDVARNTWINCEFWRDTANTVGYGMKFQFIDNCTFIECASSPGGGVGLSIFIEPPTGTDIKGFPAAITFINCPILGPQGGADGSWVADETFFFWPFPVGDGELLPTCPIPGQVLGITTKGEYVGGLRIGTNTTAIKKHLSITGNLTFTSIAASFTQDQAINVAGCLVGDTVVVNCFSIPAAGLVLSAFVAAADTVNVRWANVTAGALTPLSGASSSYRIDVWQH